MKLTEPLAEKEEAGRVIALPVSAYYLQLRPNTISVACCDCLEVYNLQNPSLENILIPESKRRRTMHHNILGLISSLSDGG